MSESEWIKETDAMGREKFWEDAGRPENDGLALKIFSETCCSDCSCKTSHKDKKESSCLCGNKSCVC